MKRKFAFIDLDKKYLVDEQRWDILSKVLTIVLRGKGLRGIDLSKAIVEVKPYKADRLQFVIYEEENND